MIITLHLFTIYHRSAPIKKPAGCLCKVRAGWRELTGNCPNVWTVGGNCRITLCYSISLQTPNAFQRAGNAKMNGACVSRFPGIEGCWGMKIFTQLPNNYVIDFTLWPGGFLMNAAILQIL